MDMHTAYSAVKIDVSDVSSSCDSKVLVLSHESSTRDVITSLLKKLKMRDYDSAAFVVEAEILAEKDVAILQFEDEDRLMQAYQQFPKGSIRLCMRYKSEFDMDIADEKREGKAGINGHQLTIQRIRRSLEKLKRKSGTSKGSSTKQPSTSQPAREPPSAPASKPADTTAAPSTPRSARPPIKPHSPAKVKSQGVSTSVTTPRGQRSPGAADKTTKAAAATAASSSHGATDRRREYRNRAERSRRRSYAGDEQSGHKSPYSLSSKQLSYKTTTVPQVGSGAASDTECMIFYDSAGDPGGSVSHLPSHNAPLTSRSHVMPRPVELQSNKQSVMIDKPMKMAFKTLEDSGIDVKSPPNSGNVRERGVSSAGDAAEYRKSTPAKANGLSQESYVSPTLSESSPFSFVSANDGNHVKRTGSFSSLKSLPVTVFKEPGGSPFMFEPIHQERLSRTKSQSMTNLHSGKVVRRRSLPPLDVSQEKLEQKKSSLSKRLAKKISNFRNNEKRYMLPSPHTFTSQNLQHYKSPPERRVAVAAATAAGDNRGEQQQDNDDNVSLADMEVAHILEGKPEHPTDSDVEDYLACVESTNTTQSEGQHGECGHHMESTPYSQQADKYHTQQMSSAKAQHKVPHLDHNRNNHKKHPDPGQEQCLKSSPKKHVSEQKVPKAKLVSRHEFHDSRHVTAVKSRDAAKISDSRSRDDLCRSLDSGIESAHPRAQQQQQQQQQLQLQLQQPKVATSGGDKDRLANGGPKPKKSLNKFVEQSMQSFLNDCHNSTTLTDADILDMHHAALQDTINSPKEGGGGSSRSFGVANLNGKSPSGQGQVDAEQNKAPFVQAGCDATKDVAGKQTNQHASEYEQARARFAHMAMSTAAGDVTSGSQSARRDTTYKSNIQLKLQTTTATSASAGAGPIRSPAPREQGGQSDYSSDAHARITPPPPPPRRRDSTGGGGDHASAYGQAAREKHRPHGPPDRPSEEEWAGKALTLFAIVRTHCIRSVYAEKGGAKTFGIGVKRVLFTPCGKVKDVAGGHHNVVIVHELLPTCPPGVAAALLPNDVIIEINGHNVLQSSDKVVKTLLDARSLLEMVIARANEATMESGTRHESSLSKSPLVFHDMEQISTDMDQQVSGGHFHCGYEHSSGSRSARSKQYEQRYEPHEQRYEPHKQLYQQSLIAHDVPLGLNEQRSVIHEQRSRQYEQLHEQRHRQYEQLHEQRHRQYEQPPVDSATVHRNAKDAQYDSFAYDVITSPRFNQLSEGPTFLL